MQHVDPILDVSVAMEYRTQFFERKKIHSEQKTKK
jgi:hypothetical protein